MPLLPLRDYAYLAAILVIALGLAWWHHSAVLEGEAKVRATDAKAVVLAQQAVKAQKQADLKTSSDAVAGLKDELQKLKDHPPAPVVVRLRCGSAASRPPSPAAAGTTSPESRPTASGGLQPVPDANPDLGPGLQRLALACDTLSAEHRALLEWARGIAR